MAIVMDRLWEASDEELERAYRRASDAAHDAPKSSIDNPSDAWARFGNEACHLGAEIDRRKASVTYPL